MKCAICEVRKPKRYCPGVQGEICTICCGTEREQSIDCPLDCEYLQDAHEHERHAELKAESIPNSDIEVSEEFLQQNEWVLLLLSSALAEGAMKNPGVTDYDIRDALDSLVQTYRTLQSGLYYEARPSNPYAAAITESVQNRVDDIRKREMEARGISTSSLRDSTVLGVVAFLQRLERTQNNGRKRSKAFLDFLTRMYGSMAPPEEAAVEPPAPQIIL